MILNLQNKTKKSTSNSNSILACQMLSFRKTNDDTIVCICPVPGNAYRPDVDLTAYLSKSPDPARVLSTLQEAHAWFSNDGPRELPTDMLADCACAVPQRSDKPWPEGNSSDRHPGQKQ